MTGGKHIVTRHRRLVAWAKRPWSFILLCGFVSIVYNDFGLYFAMLIRAFGIVFGILSLVFSGGGDTGILTGSIGAFFETAGSMFEAAAPGFIFGAGVMVFLFHSSPPFPARGSDGKWAMRPFMDWHEEKMEDLREMENPRSRDIYEGWEGICQEHGWQHPKEMPKDAKVDNRDYPPLKEVEHIPGDGTYPAHLRIVWAPLGRHPMSKWNDMSIQLSNHLNGVGPPRHTELGGRNVETRVFIEEMEGKELKTLAQVKKVLNDARQWLVESGDAVTDRTILAVIGTRKSGGYAVANLSGGSAAHLALGGKTQSGKTSTLAALILGFLVQKCLVVISDGSNAGEFTHLRDLGVTMAPFRKYNDADAGDDTSDIVARLNDHLKLARGVRAELNRRAGILNDEGVGNWQNLKLDAQGNPPFPPLIFVIDEAASLMLSGKTGTNAMKKLADDLNTAWLDIILNGAKNGVHVLMVSQRWDVSIFSNGLGGILRDQMAPVVVTKMDPEGMNMLFKQQEAFMGAKGETRFMSLNNLPSAMSMDEGRAYFVPDNDNGINRVQQIAVEAGYEHPIFMDPEPELPLEAATVHPEGVVDHSTGEVIETIPVVSETTGETVADDYQPEPVQKDKPRVGKQKVSDAQVREAAQRYVNDPDLTWSMLADELGVSHSSLSRRAKKFLPA